MSVGGVRTSFADGRLNSIAIGVNVPRGDKKKIILVAYALCPPVAFIPSTNGRYMSW